MKNLGAAIRRPGSRPSRDGDAARLHGRLVVFLEGLDLAATDGLNDQTSLLRSGLLDSMALFHLVGWIERQIGCPVDPTSFDLVQELDTVPGIVAFIEKRRQRGDAETARKDRR